MPILPLSSSRTSVRYPCGDFDVRYSLDRLQHAVGFCLLPHAAVPQEVAPRLIVAEGPEVAHRPASWGPMAASCGETSLVQIKLREDAVNNHWTAGRTLRHNATVDGLRLVEQTAAALDGGGWRIVTTLRGARPFLCRHVLTYLAGDQSVTVTVEIENTGQESLELELLASFCLGGLSPYAVDDAPERLRLHRFRSVWAAEGRHEAPLLEELNLGRTWGTGATNVERFGQVGSLPVRGWFPWVGLEDSRAGVIWAAQLHAPASWQIEVFRRDDRVSISGGLADLEFGHWKKSLQPGERFCSPPAWLTAAKGDLDTVCQRLVRMQTAAVELQPREDQDLPILFNEWCSTWGRPTPEFIARTAASLRDWPVKIFVIDAGWFEDPHRIGQFNGDWRVDRTAFPDGLKPVCDALRAQGLVPGLWFEFENVTRGTEAYTLSRLLLHKDGKPLEVGNRRFWNFSQSEVQQLLAERVIARLREDGFGYMKVDYNESIGIGSDHADSLGEGLRQNQEQVQTFFRRVRAEIPGILIENCSSGGHRLEPTFLGLTAMSSFSDAHEGYDVPIIAANLHRLMLPRQSQVWAVLHEDDTLARLHWSLAAGFLGRLCLSGQVVALSPEQRALIAHDLHLYRAVVPIIRDGESRLHRQMSASWRYPRGWQVVTREKRGEAAPTTPRELLIVAHAFGETAGTTFTVPLPAGTWSIRAERGHGVERAGDSIQPLVLRSTGDYSAYLAHLHSS